MTPAEQKRAIERQIKADQRKAAADLVAKLKADVRAARLAKKDAAAAAKDACRTGRDDARAHIEAMRAELRAAIQAERDAAHSTCIFGIEAARALSGEIAQRRAQRDAELRFQADMRRITRANAQKHLQLAKTRGEARAESDDEVRQNIPEELIALFDRVKRQIRAEPRKSRTEAFLEYVEAHPKERDAAIDDKTDALIAELEAMQRSGMAEAGRGNLSPMAKRYIGDAVIEITYSDHGDYRGTIRAGGHTWRFSDLHVPAAGFGFAYDSAEAYDAMAASAASFGSYYTSHNRGDYVPAWAPSPETADAIESAVSWAQNDRGEYEVKRRKAGGARDATVRETGSTWSIGSRGMRESSDRTIYISPSQNLAALIDNAYGYLTNSQGSALMRAIDDAEREGEDPKRAAIEYLRQAGFTVRVIDVAREPSGMREAPVLEASRRRDRSPRGAARFHKWVLDAIYAAKRPVYVVFSVVGPFEHNPYDRPLADEEMPQTFTANYEAVTYARELHRQGYPGKMKVEQFTGAVDNRGVPLGTVMWRSWKDDGWAADTWEVTERSGVRETSCSECSEQPQRRRLVPDLRRRA